MAGVNNGENLEVETNGDEAEMNKFQGFAQKDGERIEPQPKTTAGRAQGGSLTPSKAASVASKAAAAKTAPAAAVEEEEEHEETVEKPVKSAQDRINKSVAKQRAAERERDAATARYAILEQRLARLEGGTTTTPAQQATQQRAAPAGDPKDPAPDAAKYEFGEADVQFIKDLTRWEVRQELAAEKQRQTQTQQTQALTEKQQETQKAFTRFFTLGSEKFGDDFESMVKSEDIKISQPLAMLMLDSDSGPDIAFDIANDPELGKKVSAMSPERQAAWFGSYEETHYSSQTGGAAGDEEDDDEAEVATKPAPKPAKPISKAPKPLAHKNKGGGSSEIQDASTNDFAAFERMASKQR